MWKRQAGRGCTVARSRSSAISTCGRLAASASALYSKNLLTFVETMIDKKEKKLRSLGRRDHQGTLLTREGSIVHAELPAEDGGVTMRSHATTHASFRASEAREPESITRRCEYGFQARRFAGVRNDDN